MSGIRRGRWLAMLAVATGCAGDLRSTTGDGGTALRDVRRSAVITGSPLIEASGLARSTRVPGVLWSMDDSGHEPWLHAVDTAGRARGSTRVTGARNRDWEALATGPCAAGSCVYVGDVGDNTANDTQVMIWRVPEPTPGDTATPRADSLAVRWPEGPVDVEAMYVGPDTSLWFVTKRPSRGADSAWRPVRVYVVEAGAWSRAGVAVGQLVDSLPIVPRKKRPSLWVTDAALSPPDAQGRRRVAVRTYAHVFVFAADAVTGRPGALEANCSLAALDEAQGEGLAWLDAERLAFLSEGAAVPLQWGRCAAAPPR